MRTTYLSDAKIKLANALDNKDTLTCENWIEVVEQHRKGFSSQQI